MAVKTVNAQGFDVTMALGQTAQVRQTAANGSQSFGEVLNKASSEMTEKSQSVAKNEEPTKPQTETGSKKTEDLEENPKQTDSMEETEASPEAVKEVVKELVDDADSMEAKDMPDEKPVVIQTQEEPDNMTTEQIADALSRIIEQIKQLLGVSDEEVLAGMESIGMEQADLLNIDNVAQLLTAVAGEGETISFVTNEDLYAALQEMTTTVEQVSSQLLEDTGLTQEELDAVLQKLTQMPKPVQEEPLQPIEPDGEPGVTDTVNKDAVLPQKEVPTVVIEENAAPMQEKETAHKQSAAETVQRQYENQQENPTNGTVKLQSQKPEHEAGRQGKSDDFNGQQGTAYRFGDNLEAFKETTQTAAQIPVSYTSQTVDSIIRQLADFVKIVRNEKLTEMELQLHPASLGTVNVSLVTKGGSVTAEFTTQNEAVRAAIESQVSQLVTNLEEQGVKVEAVEVSVASHEMERNLEEDSQNDQSRQEQEERQRVPGTRRNSINFNSFADGDEIAEEMQGADDATRIAMELMAANGNSMDLMA